MIGKENDGWRGAITTLMNERASIGGGGSSDETSMDALIRLARETDWEGRPALDDPSVRQRLADFYIRSKGLQYTESRTLTALSRGQTPGPEASIGKLVGAPLRQEMATFAVALQGMAGSVTDTELSESQGVWQSAYIGSPGIRLAGGTDEILRNIVAERVLGLPGEARADKGLAFQDVPTGPPSR